MNIFQQHEIFEIEVLDWLRRSRALDPLVFGGGTMLRLCHELSRYSVDLDFWFIKAIQENEFFSIIQQSLGKDYEITDARITHYTIRLFRVLSGSIQHIGVEVYYPGKMILDG